MASLPDTDTIDLLRTRARHHAEHFTLPLRDRNWRGKTGEHAGTGSGSSLDFQDHRVYLPGDDPRHINWQAYARSGQYSLKLYREEVRPVVEILFDISGSMFADQPKAIRSLELLFFAIASAEFSAAMVSLFLLKDRRWKLIPRPTYSGQAWLAEIGTDQVTESSLPPNVAEAPLKPRSLRVLVSDLLYPAEPDSLLRALTREGGKGLVLAPFAETEEDPPWRGNCEFADTESRILHHRRVDSSLLLRYRTAYRDHFARWKAASRRYQVPLGRIPSTGSFEESLRSEALPSGVIQLS